MPHIYNRIYNCTPAQFPVVMATTLPAAGFGVIQAPIKFTGIILGGGTGGATLSPVNTVLGVAQAYELLAASGITNTGSTVVSGGNIGSFATPSITGFPPGILAAPAVIDNANASAAQTALAAAIVHYQGVTPTLSGLTNLSTGGNGTTAATYTAGNYFGSTSLTIPTSITLDAQGNPNATFVFVAGSTINLASGSSVLLLNGAQANNVVFVAGSSYTSVATSTMNGNVLAAVSITLGGGVQNGRALANTGAVTISAATTATLVQNSAPINPSAGLGQIDFTYDGQYFLRFFGANPAPVSEEVYAGVVENQMTTPLVVYLDQTLFPTLGNPVPSNIAVPSYNSNTL